MTGQSTELISVLLRGYESKDLDYKGPMAWDDADKKSKCELVKDILAMANTLGGYLVIGVSEQPQGFLREGLSNVQCDSFDSTKINGFVQSYADPPINTTVRKLRHDGNSFVIIEVPRFQDTPHLCQKDFPGVLLARTLYVRTDNNESAAIKTSADFRAVVEQAIRNRSDALLTSMRSILVGGSAAMSGLRQSAEAQYTDELQSARSEFDGRNPLANKNYGYFFECSFAPETYAHGRFRIEDLRSKAFEATIDYTGWPFLFIHHNRPDVLTVFQNGIQTFIFDDGRLFRGSALLDFWRFYQSGFFFKKEMPHWAAIQPDVAVFPEIARYCAMAVDCLVRLYDKFLDPKEVVALTITLWETEGRKMVNSPDRGPLFGDYICHIPNVQVNQTHSLADWRAGVEDHSVELMREVQVRFNWIPPNIDLATQVIRGMFARTL